MSEISKYEEYKNKLQGVCEANNLVFALKKDHYPVKLIIRPSGGVGEQLSMLEEADRKGYRSPDAYIQFSYDEDGTILVDPSGRFQIGDALFNKIKNLFKKLCFFWLMFFFRDVVTKNSLQRGMMPVINEDDADDAGDEDAGGDTEDEEDAEEEGEDCEGDREPEFDYAASEKDPGAEVAEDLIEQATQIVRVENKATISLLQRRMNIGYAQAARIMDRLEELGVVSGFNGGDQREVLPFDVPEDEDNE